MVYKTYTLLEICNDLSHKPSGTSLCSSIKNFFNYKMLKCESHLHPKYIVTNSSIKKLMK